MAHLPQGHQMSSHLVVTEATAKIPTGERCCDLIEKLSLYELHALFYKDLDFQVWFLNHVLEGKCEPCAKKLRDCHPVVNEREFRMRIAEYLHSGQAQLANFRQSATSAA